MIATTSEQDATIAKKMNEETKKDYNLLFSNCGQAVTNSLLAAIVPTTNIGKRYRFLQFKSNIYNLIFAIFVISFQYTYFRYKCFLTK